MIQTKWFDRQFPLNLDNGLLVDIIERLEGTPVRLAGKIDQIIIPKNVALDGRWSIKKEIGHLLDLEPLWLERAFQIINDHSQLKQADLTNRKTHETDHDERNLPDLVSEFREARQQLVDLLRAVKDEDLEKSATHPRLGTPMRLTDLAYFVAEHDDHHLAKITLLSNHT